MEGMEGNEPPGLISQPGVFVFASRDGESIQIRFENLGGVDPLSIPIMLEHASRIARQQIGLPPDRLS